MWHRLIDQGVRSLDDELLFAVPRFHFLAKKGDNLSSETNVLHGDLAREEFLNGKDLLKEVWTSGRKKLPCGYSTLAGETVMVTEWIPPVSIFIMDQLADAYHPVAEDSPAGWSNLAKSVEANCDCLVFLYLGKQKRRPIKADQFSTRNFVLCLDEIKELGLDIRCTWIPALAQVLAYLHFYWRCDGRRVRISLGGSRAADTLRRAENGCHNSAAHNRLPGHLQMWVHDFDHVNSIPMTEKGMKDAAAACLANEQYFPRPYTGKADSELSCRKDDEGLWTLFASEYRKQAHEAVRRKDQWFSQDHPSLRPDEVANLAQSFLGHVDTLVRGFENRTIFMSSINPVWMLEKPLPLPTREEVLARSRLESARL